MVKSLLITGLLVLSSLSALAQAPTVTTGKRFVRGATMAFGRLTCVGHGSAVSERGFCYATHPNPTVADSTTTETLSLNGTIYWLRNLAPSTSYYMRAYAKAADGSVGYGEVRHFYTLPKATISYTIRPDAANPEPIARITSAVKEAVDYWTNLTSMQGFYPNVGYNPGTPTADCSYGGWVRVGSNASYQRTGTILHEFLHGVGVGTTDTWYNNPDMRSNTSRGTWLGDRVTNVVRFLADNNTAMLDGDTQHLWPYGINGAHEDTGDPALYIANSLVCQALGEDGLPLTSAMGFATPYDALDAADGVKYYLKSEDAGHGLYTSYLVEQGSLGALRWRTMTTAEAMANDSAAWFFSYNPSTCLYTMRNAATGHYVTYSGSSSRVFSARAVDATDSRAQLQLMPGRAKVAEVDSLRGYFLLSNQHSMTSPCLMAANSGATTTGAFTFSNDATDHRWMIFTADECAAFDTQAFNVKKEEVDVLLTQMQKLRFVRHTQNVSGINTAFSGTIRNLRQSLSAATTAAGLDSIIAAGYEATYDFLSKVTATDAKAPFDLTFMVSDPAVATLSGWHGAPTLAHDCAEFYERNFDFYQELQHKLPQGTYRLHLQAFQRPGTTAATYTQWLANRTQGLTATLYAAQSGKLVDNIWDCALKGGLGKGAESSQGGRYVPNDMESAASYFDYQQADGSIMYDDTLTFSLSEPVEHLRIGITDTFTPQAAGAKVEAGPLRAASIDNYWTIFRNFRLFYLSPAEATGITAPSAVAHGATPQAVYNLMGQRLRQGTSLRGLPSGIYIVNGKKVRVR